MAGPRLSRRSKWTTRPSCTRRCLGPIRAPPTAAGLDKAAVSSRNRCSEALTGQFTTLPMSRGAGATRHRLLQPHHTRSFPRTSRPTRRPRRRGRLRAPITSSMTAYADPTHPIASRLRKTCNSAIRTLGSQTTGPFACRKTLSTSRPSRVSKGMRVAAAAAGAHGYSCLVAAARVRLHREAVVRGETAVRGEMVVRGEWGCLWVWDWELVPDWCSL